MDQVSATTWDNEGGSSNKRHTAIMIGTDASMPEHDTQADDPIANKSGHECALDLFVDEGDGSFVAVFHDDLPFNLRLLPIFCPAPFENIARGTESGVVVRRSGHAGRAGFVDCTPWWPLTSGTTA